MSTIVIRISEHTARNLETLGVLIAIFLMINAVFLISLWLEAAQRWQDRNRARLDIDGIHDSTMLSFWDALRGRRPEDR